jgi:hypothetical protein
MFFHLGKTISNINASSSPDKNRLPQFRLLLLRISDEQRENQSPLVEYDPNDRIKL